MNVVMDLNESRSGSSIGGSKRNTNGQGLLSKLFSSLRPARPLKLQQQLPAARSSVSTCSTTSTAQVQLQTTSAPPSVCGSRVYLQQRSAEPGVLKRFTVDLGFRTGLELYYNVGEQLGKGGNASVFVVTPKGSDAAAASSPPLQYACKCISKTPSSDASELKKRGHLDSIRNEVQVLTVLKGSLSIVQLVDVFEDEDNVYVIMEYCKGGELWHRIGDRHYSERTVASFMRGVLRTLAVMHSHHILHRDVKPGNFMLLNNDDRSPLKAIDFGLAAFFEPSKLPRTDLSAEGTPWYMAPEALSSQVTPACDMWSAGVMAYQLLTGYFPFDDRANPNHPSITAIWRSIYGDQLDFNKPWWAGISSEAKDFVAKLLERNPSKRLTAKEALAHPFLRGDSRERSQGKKIAQSVVQRIQRFAQGSTFKRTVLQNIAADLMSNPNLVADAACQISEHGGAVIPAPNSACLQPVYQLLQFDQDGKVDTHHVAEALESIGFKLEPSEVKRVLEDVDWRGTGQWDRAAFAASQIDWRQLQQQNKEAWLDMAAKAFAALDKDKDGVLRREEILQVLQGTLQAVPAQGSQADSSLTAGSGGLENSNTPMGSRDIPLPGMKQPDSAISPQVGLAIALAMREAGQGPDADAMDFNGFVRMLTARSIDSLDMYDDYMGGTVHGSTVHGSTRWRNSSDQIERLNSLLHRSGGSSHHLVDASKHGTSYDRSSHWDHSNHSTSDTDSVLDNWSHHSGSHYRGTLAKEAASDAQPMVWRFDVALRPSPIQQQQQQQQQQAKASTVWRFDASPAPVPVPQKAGACWFDTPQQSGSAAGAQEGVPGAPANTSTTRDVVAAVGLKGGYFDRRHHGSDLYVNAVMRRGGAALETVQE